MTRKNELVNASDEHVQFMVDVLKDATCSENHFSETHGFNAAEICCGLNHLAVNDSNKVGNRMFHLYADNWR